MQAQTSPHTSTNHTGGIPENPIDYTHIWSYLMDIIHVALTQPYMEASLRNLLRNLPASPVQ